VDILLNALCPSAVSYEGHITLAFAPSVTTNVFEIYTPVDKPTLISNTLQHLQTRERKQKQTSGATRKEQVARPPRAEESKGRQNKCFNYRKIFFFLRSTNFK
jgi:hypothetical protein